MVIVTAVAVVCGEIYRRLCEWERDKRRQPILRGKTEPKSKIETRRWKPGGEKETKKRVRTKSERRKGREGWGRLPRGVAYSLSSTSFMAIAMA